MSKMNISLPDHLKQFVDQQVTTAGYGTSSEYICELIRRDQERTQLRQLLLAGTRSKPTGLADEAYFADLRADIKKRPTQSKYPPMLTKIFINGDSLAVRIPKEMSFKEDQGVDIAREGDTLVIRPIRRDSLAGVVGAFASFPAGFMAEGRDFNEQAKRD